MNKKAVIIIAFVLAMGMLFSMLFWGKGIAVLHGKKDDETGTIDSTMLKADTGEKVEMPLDDIGNEPVDQIDIRETTIPSEDKDGKMGSSTDDNDTANNNFENGPDAHTSENTDNTTGSGNSMGETNAKESYENTSERQESVSQNDGKENTQGKVEIKDDDIELPIVEIE